MLKMNHSIKRKIVQLAAFGYSNPYLANFKGGRLYTGKWKQFCNPGLNCYSCPAASLACPIGALQAVSGSVNYKFSFYVIGILLAFGILLGRAVCGWLCPFGLLQELLHKIPFPKLKLKKGFLYIKYIVLAVFVIALPIVVTDYMGMGKPAFCQYICPAGMLEGGIPLLLSHEALRKTVGSLFTLKMTILIVTVIGCLLVYRFFCKTLCPLGAIYGLLNKISIYRLDVDEHKCIKCGKCRQVCKMEVDPVKTPDSAECAQACPEGAICLKFGGRENMTLAKNKKEN